ncbi:tRNA pseudouridine synthase B [Amphibacillus marinus]|uniref:tRNA pseudouridine synthase B n=1 Tax=Amphibacillus marinus TaxID=872970 RepID=A0A1H8HLH5_9BACI|nr:tRNA pseudouridine(55) synthase TruB [Amphibacillus marinus]SEN57021.1 tRNA pseudouridine synthase B [Amphibacillus marinus]
MNGIVPLWKPVGLTSHDCVIKLRRIFATKKVGHTGTLDPEVAGVLPICIGEATKVVPYLTNTKKTYLAEVTLGIATDTEDQTGQIIDQVAINQQLSKTTIKAVLANFVGEITQITPLYSAVKVNGRKLYEYARANEPVERPIRHVTVHQLAYIEDSFSQTDGKVSFKISTTVSKGTYIRTLAVDIGRALGYPAHMSHLIRTRTADFTEATAIGLDQLESLKQEGDLQRILLPIEAGLTHLPIHNVSASLAKKVLNGQKLARPEGWSANEVYRIEYEDKLLAIYQVHPSNSDLIKPLRVFNYATKEVTGIEGRSAEQ